MNALLSTWMDAGKVLLFFGILCALSVVELSLGSIFAITFFSDVILRPLLEALKTDSRPDRISYSFLSTGMVYFLAFTFSTSALLFRRLLSDDKDQTLSFGDCWALTGIHFAVKIVFAFIISILLTSMVGLYIHGPG